MILLSNSTWQNRAEDIEITCPCLHRKQTLKLFICCHHHLLGIWSSGHYDPKHKLLAFHSGNSLWLAFPAITSHLPPCSMCDTSHGSKHVCPKSMSSTLVFWKPICWDTHSRTLLPVTGLQRPLSWKWWMADSRSKWRLHPNRVSSPSMPAALFTDTFVREVFSVIPSKQEPSGTMTSPTTPSKSLRHHIGMSTFLSDTVWRRTKAKTQSSPKMSIP